MVCGVYRMQKSYGRNWRWSYNYTHAGFLQICVIFLLQLFGQQEQNRVPTCININLILFCFGMQLLPGLKPFNRDYCLTSKRDSSYGPGAACAQHFACSGSLPAACQLAILTNSFSHASHFYNRRPIMNTQTGRKSSPKSKLTTTRGVPWKCIN